MEIILLFYCKRMEVKFSLRKVIPYIIYILKEIGYELITSVFDEIFKNFTQCNLRDGLENNLSSENNSYLTLLFFFTSCKSVYVLFMLWRNGKSVLLQY